MASRWVFRTALRKQELANTLFDDLSDEEKEMLEQPAQAAEQPIEEVPVEETPKKKRGRPKKEEQAAEPVETQAEETPKKKRGRPKKGEPTAEQAEATASCGSSTRITR